MGRVKLLEIVAVECGSQEHLILLFILIIIYCNLRGQSHGDRLVDIDNCVAFSFLSASPLLLNIKSPL